MPLAGQAIIAIWNDITPEGRANFHEWHPREHMPERVAIPGFLRGRRYIGVEAEIAYFTLYEAVNADVLTGPDYKARLNNPTPWSKASVGAFRNNLRGVARIVHSSGNVDGANLFTIRLSPEPGKEAALEAFLKTELPAIHARAEIGGAHLVICDPAKSGTNTSLQRERTISVPDWIVMIEAVSPEAARTQGRALLESLPRHGVKPGAIGELYRLEYSLVKIAA